MCQIFRNTPEKGLNLYNCGCYTSSKSGDLELCPSKTLFFGTFLEKILFLTHFGQIYPPMIYIKGKLCISAFCTYPNNRVFFEPAGRQNFANTWRQKRAHVLRPRRNKSEVSRQKLLTHGNLSAKQELFVLVTFSQKCDKTKAKHNSKLFFNTG